MAKASLRETFTRAHTSCGDGSASIWFCFLLMWVALVRFRSFAFALLSLRVTMLVQTMALNKTNREPWIRPAWAWLAWWDNGANRLLRWLHATRAWPCMGPSDVEEMGRVVEKMGRVCQAAVWQGQLCPAVVEKMGRVSLAGWAVGVA